MSLRRRILRIAADLPKGDTTRRELIALLQKRAFPNPPPDVANLFQNLMSDGSLITRNYRAINLASDFVSEITDYIGKKPLTFSEVGDLETTTEEVYHKKFGEFDLEIEHPTFGSLDIGGKVTWVDFVKFAMKELGVRGNPKQVAVRLTGSGAWFKYLQQCKKSLEEDALDEAEYNLENHKAAILDHADDETSVRYDDEFDDIDYRVNFSLEYNPSMSYCEILFGRRGFEWGGLVVGTIAVESASVSGGSAYEPPDYPSERWFH